MKKGLFTVAMLLISSIALAQYRISTEGISKQFSIEDIPTGKTYNYPRQYITAEINELGNIVILLKEGSSDGRPFAFSRYTTIPFTEFRDGNNADATLASAEAVRAWFYDNTGFKTASGGSGAWTIQGDGVTDNTTAIETALSTYGQVEIIGDVITSTPIALTADMNIYGSGSIDNSTSNVFTLTGKHIKVKDITIGATGGHAFVVSGIVYSSAFENLVVTVQNAGNSGFQCIGTNQVYDTNITGGEWQSSPNHNVPIINVSVSGDYFNSNTISNLRFQSNGSPTAPEVRLECTSPSVWIYGNTISDVNFEVADAGAIHLFSTSGTVIQNVDIWDNTTTTDDLILIDNTVGGLNCKATTIINTYFLNGTTGGGLFDLNILGHYSQGLTIINSGGSSGHLATFNLPSSAVVLNSSDVTSFGSATPLNVSAIKKTGTLTDNQILVATADGVAESTSALTYTGEKLSLSTTSNKNTDANDVFSIGSNDGAFPLQLRISRKGTGTKRYEIDAINQGVGGAPIIIKSNTGIGVLTNPIERLEVDGNVKSTGYKLTALNAAPATATSTGTTGEIRYTATHIYVCTATNTWVRAALTTW